ncbi:MAG: RNase adapter RapZ [Lachnospiraceae bacterium]|nr:RNase adapter RapZ [Lachnospiraceae bacterium]
MEFIIVTGMSGAGKTTTFKCLEDMGFYCVDNLPVSLLSNFVDLCKLNSDEMKKVALGVDTRTKKTIKALTEILDTTDELDVLFLDANDKTLIKRYKETRRSHPLAKDNRIENGIAAERDNLAPLKRRARHIIDTSGLLTREFQEELKNIFVLNKSYKNLYIQVLSFGFKYGIPADCDMVLDVRFLPNPFYVDELKQKTGLDQEVYDFVFRSHEAVEFLDKLEDMVRFLLPQYIREGKNQLVIGIGCTGGKHRSVSIARALSERLKGDEEYGLKTEHRDIKR